MKKYKKNLNKIIPLISPINMARGIKRFLVKDKKILVIGTAHKVGSTWLYNMVFEAAWFYPGIMGTKKKYFESGTLLLDKEGCLETIAKKERILHI